MANCQQELRKQGKSYPRTCEVCGLGPCVYDLPIPKQKDDIVYQYRVINHPNGIKTESEWLNCSEIMYKELADFFSPRTILEKRKLHQFIKIKFTVQE